MQKKKVFYCSSIKRDATETEILWKTPSRSKMVLKGGGGGCVHRRRTTMRFRVFNQWESIGTFWSLCAFRHHLLLFTLSHGMSIANAADVQSLNVSPLRSSDIQSPLGTCRRGNAIERRRIGSPAQRPLSKHPSLGIERGRSKQSFPKDKTNAKPPTEEDRSPRLKLHGRNNNRTRGSDSHRASLLSAAAAQLPSRKSKKNDPHWQKSLYIYIYIKTNR